MPEIIPVIVAVIDNQEGKRLLLKRAPHKKWAPGLWNIVSGHIDGEEEPLQAALREVEEETKLPVQLRRQYPVYDVDYEGKIWRTWAFRFFTEHANPHLNDEHVAHQWIYVDELYSYEIIPIMLEDLKQMGYLS